MKIDILVDNPESWMVPYARKLEGEISALGHECKLLLDQAALSAGEILLLLSCERILTREKRALHKHNLVVHESALPHGKGWSPVTWQVLEGKNEIPVSLIEADDKVDSGAIYAKATMTLKGDELVDEIRKEQYRITRELILGFIKNYPDVRARTQEGKETLYTKRTPEESRLDPDLTLREQFNLLRVVDNDRYPAFFTIDNNDYVIRIERKKGARKKGDRKKGDRKKGEDE